MALATRTASTPILSKVSSRRKKLSQRLLQSLKRKQENVDSYGFARPTDPELMEQYRQFEREYKDVLERRAQRWIETGMSRKFSAESRGGGGKMSMASSEPFLRKKTSSNSNPMGGSGGNNGVRRNPSSVAEGHATGARDWNDEKLKRFVRKGVPSGLRPSVWFKCVGGERAARDQPGLFAALIAKSAARPQVEKEIDLDLQRTFPSNVHFVGMTGQATRHNLELVLRLWDCPRAIAVRYPQVGYCQGMNYIGGLLLLVTEQPEKAFWLMDAALRTLWPYYVNDMQGLRVDMLVLDRLLMSKCPALGKHLAKHGADMLLLASKWFLCWYINVLPIETVLRIWDCFFNEGSKIFFRVALTLFISNKQCFLRCKNLGEITRAVQDITKNDAAINCHQFMKDIFTVTGSLRSSSIQKFRTEFYGEQGEPSSTTVG